MGEQPQSGDGLVMPEAFPCKSKDIEAYSQATCQPVKPLVRARLRMAVNKPY